MPLPIIIPYQSRLARNTLADANRKRDWRIYRDLAQRLLARARPLYAQEDSGVDLANTICALDSTTIDLCLSLFPWARFRATKAAVKLHTLSGSHGAASPRRHLDAEDGAPTG